MGEYADADIWARQNGLEDGMADMDPGDWARFYKQYDDTPPKSRSTRTRCPTCGKRFRSDQAVRDHHRDVHARAHPHHRSENDG